MSTPLGWDARAGGAGTLRPVTAPPGSGTGCAAGAAGWWNILLDRAVDLTWLIDPGSVQSALITGMFGIQPEPTWGELLAFLAYAVPMTVYVCRPQPPKARAEASPMRVVPTVEPV